MVFGSYSPGDILANPGDPNGVYKMIAEDNSLFDVYVDMETDGGGSGAHADYTTKKRLYIRAKNFGQ